jgi:hypothetical protein
MMPKQVISDLRMCSGRVPRLRIWVVNLRLIAAVVRHPSLWLEALRAAQAHGSREWWRRLLLVPEPEYMRWRLTTAYGDAARGLEPRDAVRYLRWRRSQRVA